MFWKVFIATRNFTKLFKIARLCYKFPSNFRQIIHRFENNFSCNSKIFFLFCKIYELYFGKRSEIHLEVQVVNKNENSSKPNKILINYSCYFHGLRKYHNPHVCSIKYWYYYKCQMIKMNFMTSSSSSLLNFTWKISSALVSKFRFLSLPPFQAIWLTYAMINEQETLEGVVEK